MTEAVQWKIICNLCRQSITVDNPNEPLSSWLPFQINVGAGPDIHICGGCRKRVRDLEATKAMNARPPITAQNTLTILHGTEHRDT